MIQDGLELPAARNGRFQCGPLLVFLVALYGATLREQTELAEQAELIAERIKAAGPLAMDAPRSIQ